MEFDKLFRQTQGIVQKQYRRSYASLHRDMLFENFHHTNHWQRANETQYNFATDGFHTGTNVRNIPQPEMDYLKLQESMCLSGTGRKNDKAGFDGATGSMFIDVFKHKDRPLHGKNVAMLYVVGTRGEGCRRVGNTWQYTGDLDAKGTFKEVVGEIARNALDMVQDYNDRCDAQKPCYRKRNYQKSKIFGGV